MGEQLQIQMKTDHKISKLILGLVLDIVGMMSYLIPGLGEFTDVIWAPISGIILARIYKGTIGKVAGIISFLEEATPGLDVTPTFTLTWMYTYLIKGEK